jgi:hypothetical protein
MEVGMGHPLIDEFCRQPGELRADFYRRCQRVFRDEVQPALDEAERLKVENAALKADLEKWHGKAARRKAEAVVE